jgi:hypothetical protein
LTATPMRSTAKTVHGDFKNSGCIASLQRLALALTQTFPIEFKRNVGTIPSWVYSEDFSSVCSAVSVRDAREYARRFIRMANFIKTNVYEEDSNLPSFLVNPESDSDEMTNTTRSVARCKILLGSMLEAFAVRSSKCLPRTSTHSDLQKDFARLSKDAYFAALWTDAHVVFLCDTIEAAGIADMPADSTFIKNGTFGNPTIKRTLSISACPLLCREFDRYINGHFPILESLRNLLNLVVRCNQSGARGWDTAVKTAMGYACNADVLFKMFASACLGMHPNIHPAARMTWQTRMFVGRILKEVCKPQISTLFTKCSGASKEAVKMWIAALLDDMPAMSTAFAASGNSLGLLTSTPAAAPSLTMQTSSQNFVNLTLEAVVNMFKLNIYSADVLADELANGVGLEQRTRRRGSSQAGKSNDGAKFSPVIRGVEGQVVIASSKNSQIGCNAMDVVGEMLSRAFRTEFLPLWIHGHGIGVRVGRLDPSQFDVVHSTSACARVTASLTDTDIVKLVRSVVNNPKARCESIDAICQELGAGQEIVNALRKANGIEATINVAANLPADVGCKLFTWSKIAALKNKMLAFDLGEKTREMQLRALKFRYNIEGADVAAELPETATSLHFCMQCGKTANACVEQIAKTPKVTKSAKAAKAAAKLLQKQPPFNELGIAQVMTRVGGVDEVPHIRCAKRSSAALRTAVHKEEVARTARIEETNATPESIAHGLRDGVDSSHVQRIRRDAQTCLSQLGVATACGDNEMIKYDLLGRAVRINGKFHSICTTCASICTRQCQNHSPSVQFHNCSDSLIPFP